MPLAEPYIFFRMMVVHPHTVDTQPFLSSKWVGNEARSIVYWLSISNVANCYLINQL